MVQTSRLQDRSPDRTTLSRIRGVAGGTRSAWDAYRTDGLAVAGLVVVAIFVVLAVVPEALAPHSPTAFDAAAMQAPSAGFPMGTDTLGRDILSRIIFGARVSLLFGILAATLSLVVGATLGLIAGFVGGWVDQVLSRFFEAVIMVPAFFLLIVAVALFGNDVRIAVLVVGITIWPANARIMRASVLSLKERPFVRASVVTGASSARIMSRHILPNAVLPLIVNSNLQVGQAIMFEAGVSFLGLSDPNVVSWGRMVNEGAYHLGGAWWLSFFPGVALALLILGFNLIGRGVAAIYGQSVVLATGPSPAIATAAQK